jgi:hypothetical protein
VQAPKSLSTVLIVKATFGASREHRIFLLATLLWNAEIKGAYLFPAKQIALEVV